MVLSDELSGQLLSSRLAYWQPSEPNPSLQALPKEAAWQTVNSATANFGLRQHPIWFRLQLDVDMPASGWHLVIDNPILDNVTVYVLRDGQLQGIWVLGDKHPFAQRPIASQWFQVPLNLHQPGHYQFYFHVDTEGTLQFPLELWHQQDLQIMQGNLYAGAGAYIGFIAAVLLYNLFIYLVNRERYALYYIGFVCAYGLFYIAIEGFGFQYLWPQQIWWQQRATLTGMSFAAVFSCLFANHFLELKQRHTHSLFRLQKTTLIFAWSAVLACFLLPFASAVQWVMLVVIGICISALIIGITASLQKHYSAIMYTCGWLVLFAGVIVHVIARQGWLPLHFWIIHASHVGFVLLMLVHGLAIALRFHQQRLRFLQTEQQLLSAQREALRTRFHAQEAELKRRQSEAEQQAQSQFLAMMSHEIRTPLNGVLGMTQLLQDTPLSEDQRRLTDTISSSGRSLMTVLNDILDLSKIKSGKLELQQEETDLEQLISDCLMLYQHTASEKGLILFARFDKPLLRLCYTDPSRLRQIITNLVSNAIKFTQQGHVEIRLHYPDQGLSIDVIDTGIGIEDSYLDQLFDHFSQADRSTSRHYGGTGLGLSICQQLAKLLGGHIEVSSQLGQGSLFRLHLPHCITSDPMPLEAFKTIQLNNKVAATHPLYALVQDTFQLASISTSTSSEMSIEAISSQQLRLIAQQHITLSSPITTMQLLRTILELASGCVGHHKSNVCEDKPRLQHDVIIWVAEDNPVNQKVVSGMLRYLGYNQRLFADGQSLVDALVPGQEPALILMDCEMPYLDGFEATKAIRRLNQTLPIIALSAHALDEYQQQAQQSGMNDFLAKPVNRQQLQDMLQRWLAN